MIATNSKLAAAPRQRVSDIVGGPWAAIAQERHPRWFEGATFFQRTLGLELAHVQWGNGRRPPGIPVGDDWTESLCRTLMIPGINRRQAKPAFRALAELGLLVVEGGVARVLLTVAEVEGASTSCSPRAHLEIHTGSITNVSPENDSVPISQIRSEREEITHRAREATPVETPYTPPAEWVDEPETPSLHRIGSDFLASVGLWTPGTKREFTEYIGGRPEAERRAALGVLQRDAAWLKENGTARHVVDCWRFYAQGRTPADRPGMAKGRDRRVQVDAPKAAAGLERLRTELQAVEAQMRQAPRDSWEHTQLDNRQGELLMRISRLEAQVA